MIRLTNLKEYFTPLVDSGTSVKIAFDYEPIYDIDEEGNKVESNIGTWTEHVFKKRPSFNQIQEFILSEINRRTDELILSGFIWKDMSVWLSSENQFNYKAAYDLAVQTQGESLPYKVKLGGEDAPVYREFTSLQDFKAFYLSVQKHINGTINDGWKRKDAIDWSKYQ